MTTPFLLIPGLNCTARVYRDLGERLWPYGPVTVANHQSGGTIKEIARSVLASAPPTFVMFGFSMGGYIAFEIIRQASERVSRLCLLDTSARPDSPEQSAKRFAAISKSEQGEFETVVRANFPLAVDPSHVADPALRELHLSMSIATGPETYIRQQKAILARSDSRDTLARIIVPTLVIVGENDQITPPDAAAEMAAGIAGAKLVTVPSAGHMALVEQPELVGQAVVEWLGR